MSDSATNLLIVDDQATIRRILRRFLADTDHVLTEAENGAIAWEILDSHPDRFDVVLLDRTMPEMDGMELLTKMKADPRLDRVPVIFQTSLTAQEEILEGMQAGAFFYLEKPFDKDMLLSVVSTAIEQHSWEKNLQREMRKAAQTLRLLDAGRFSLRDLDEGRNLATLLANACPDPERVVVGLSELIINAIEHGNLGITYKEKSELNQTGQWLEEVERRLHLDEYAGKQVVVDFERGSASIRIRIADDGDGFDWQSYVEPDPERAFDNHGRGIAMSKLIYFDNLEYHGRGNEVTAEIQLTEPAVVS